jgi:hypothetical protein
MASLFHISCRNYSLADELAHELFMVADQKGAVLWKASSLIYQGCVSAASTKPADAIAIFGSQRPIKPRPTKTVSCGK